MMLFPVNNFDAQETAYIKDKILALPISFLESSSEKFIAIEGGQALAYAGTFSRSLLGTEVYWWIVLREINYTLSQLRYLRSEINKVLSARAETQLAEAAIGNLRNQKFLQFCGFKETQRSDERILYEWTN